MNRSRIVLHALAIAAVLNLAALATPDSAAWAGKPIQDIKDVSIPAGMDMKAIGDAIIDGCAVRSWIAEEVGPGHMQCTVYVRSHMAKVNINYDTSSYSITYADSEELDYDAGDYEIHRNYNSWVQNLNGDIRTALLRASR